MNAWLCMYISDHVHFINYRSDDQAPDAVEPACRLTLTNLKLEYLDLYLVHNPFTLKKVSENENQWIDENKPGYNQEGMAKTWKVC